MNYFAALKVLNKLIKMGDTTKIKATIDGQNLDKTDVDFHLFHFDLEAWRNNPQEYYCCEFSNFQLHDPPEVTVNGNARFEETGDVDLHVNNITFEITFTDTPGGQEHSLKFVYPFV